MTYLTHYYYGNRILAFQAGFGVILRATGHSKKATVYIINDSFSWVEELKEKSNIPIQIISKNETKNLSDKVICYLKELEDEICLLANFDLIFNNWFDISDFISLVKEMREKNEVIITCEKRYELLEDLGDYVSVFESQEK